MSDPRATTGHRPATPEGARAFTVTPFQRLARTHVANAMADAMIAATLADSIFFSLPADDARSPVVRYLIITMLPFAFIAPLVGPLIDRLKGGHRFVVIGSSIARAVLCYLLIGQIDEGGPTFFLLALCILVAQRAYLVARAALVPTVVGSDDELIEANSKLAVIGGLSAFVGVLPAAIFLKLFGAPWALGLAAITYATSAVLGLRIPGTRVATEKPDRAERHELRGAGIVLAGSAMGLLRMCVGFLTLLIAFDFRGGDRKPWEFAVVAGVSVLSQLVGSALAPRLKALTSEENILTASLGLVVVGTFGALFLGEVLGACIVGACVGFASGTGKMAFDSILQRDAPDANRGRSFARFETKFQVMYVLGSFIPVAIATGAKAGFAVLLAVSIFAFASYIVGRLAYAHRLGTRRNAATKAAVEIEERVAEVTGEVKGRLTAGPRSVLGRLRAGRGEPDRGAEGAGDDPTVVVEPELAPVVVEPSGPDPWEPPTEPGPPDYLEDLDPAVTNPYPWSSGPDDPTRPEPPTRP
ncbi:MAG: MFS transporter [Acidimicrobiales bacterium]